MEIRNPPTHPRLSNRISAPPEIRPVPHPQTQPPFPSTLLPLPPDPRPDPLPTRNRPALLQLRKIRSTLPTRYHLHLQPNPNPSGIQIPKRIKKILEPILRSEPVRIVLDSMIRAASNCKDSLSKVLSFVLENYSFLRLIPNSLATLERIRVLDCMPSTRGCNELLVALCSSNRFELALVCFAGLVRTGFEHDEETWYVICWIFCGRGKLKRAEKLLDLGVCGVSSYDLVIDCYCKNGDFRDAMLVLNRMRGKNLVPSFSVYASFLDGGCKFGDDGVTRWILKEMMVRELLPMVPFLDYDWVVTRLCELEKTFAAEMFIERARNVSFKLGEGVHTSLLRALAKEGRVREALDVHKIMLREGVTMSRGSCDMFMSAMCKGEPSEEVGSALKDLIGKGFVPSSDDLSMYVAAQCDRGRWVEANDMFKFVLDKGILLNSFCSSSLVKHYCTNGLVDSAALLHEKMKKSGGFLDAISYNVLLEALFSKRRIEEAIGIFEYMQEKTISNSASFVIMIKALCREREFRKAMNAHDEMLKLGLKPDYVTYRHLISGFV